MKIQIILKPEEEKYQRMITERLVKKDSNIVEFEFLGLMIEDLIFINENKIQEFLIAKEDIEQEDNVALEAIKLLKEKGYRIIKN